jgi:hypothetical protein
MAPAKYLNVTNKWHKQYKHIISPLPQNKLKDIKTNWTEWDLQAEAIKPALLFTALNTKYSMLLK